MNTPQKTTRPRLTTGRVSMLGTLHTILYPARLPSRPPRSATWRAALARSLRKRGWLTTTDDDASIDAALRLAAKGGAA